MKRISFILLSITFVISGLLSSCQQEPSESEIQDAMEQDAIGALEAFVVGAENGIPGPVPLITFTVIGGTVVSSLQFLRMSDNDNYNSNGVILPTKFHNINNPYECLGIRHNLMLNDLAKGKNDKEFSLRSNLIALNENTIQPYAEQLKDCMGIESTTPISYSSEIKNKISDLISKYQNRNVDEIVQTLADKNFITLILKKFRAQKEEKRDVESIIEGIVMEINNAINDSSISEDTKQKRLIFLSIYKHSYYFWSKL